MDIRPRTRIVALAELAAQLLFALSKDRHGHVDPIPIFSYTARLFSSHILKLPFSARTAGRMHPAASRTSPIPLCPDF